MINDLWLVFVSSSFTHVNQLPSVFLGNEDVYHLKWMHLHRGEPKRCYCGMNDFISFLSSSLFLFLGHWFKLTERQYVDLSDFGITEEMQKPAAH